MIVLGTLVPAAPPSNGRIGGITGTKYLRRGAQGEIAYTEGQAATGATEDWCSGAWDGYGSTGTRNGQPFRVGCHPTRDVFAR